VPICYINVILDEGVIMESRLVGKGIDNVKMGDKVKVSFQETHTRDWRWRLSYDCERGTVIHAPCALLLTLPSQGRGIDGENEYDLETN
jgi:hypothetical protein